MAGDWLKMEHSTPDKAEVLAITAAMGWTDADLTVGKLFRAWRWFDLHTVNGAAKGVSRALIDRIVGADGFAAAMESVGWLIIQPDHVTLPNFERHNGETAKARAMSARRTAKSRRDRDESDAATVTFSVPREEKRREEEVPPHEGEAPPEERNGAPAEPKQRREKSEIADDFRPSPEDRKWAREHEGMTDAAIDEQTARFIRHHRAKGNRFKRPDLAWRNWISGRFTNGNRNGNGRPGSGPAATTPDPAVTRPSARDFGMRTAADVLARAKR